MSGLFTAEGDVLAVVTPPSALRLALLAAVCCTADIPGYDLVHVQARDDDATGLRLMACSPSALCAVELIGPVDMIRPGRMSLPAPVAKELAAAIAASAKQDPLQAALSAKDGFVELELDVGEDLLGRTVHRTRRPAADGEATPSVDVAGVLACATADSGEARHELRLTPDQVAMLRKLAGLYRLPLTIRPGGRSRALAAIGPVRVSLWCPGEEDAAPAAPSAAEVDDARGRLRAVGTGALGEPT